MSVSVELDTIENALLRQTISGWERQRGARITGLSGTALNRELQALNALPPVGSLFAGLPVLIRLESKEITALSGTLAEAVLTYRTPSGNRAPTLDDTPQLEVGGSLETARTDIDKDGNPLLVSYNPPSGSEFEPVDQHIKEARFQRPSPHVRLTRREQITGLQLLATKLQFEAHTNETEFLGWPQDHWLMGNIDGRSDDGGDTYVVSYPIFFARETWDVRLKVQAQESGSETLRIPDDISEGNGLHTYSLYPRANFNLLGIT